MRGFGWQLLRLVGGGLSGPNMHAEPEAGNATAAAPPALMSASAAKDGAATTMSAAASARREIIISPDWLLFPSRTLA